MDSAERKNIVLNGKTFSIGYLPFAKNRKVIPATDYAFKAYKRSLPPTSEPLNVTAIDNTYLAIFEAVNYADPKVTREIFDSWPLNMQELITALIVIAQQTGVLVQQHSEGKPITGEA